MASMDARHVDEENFMRCFDDYVMTHRKRGVAYIFNETFKDPKHETRHSPLEDTQAFQNALENLGFDRDDIKVYTDIPTEDIRHIFQQFNEINCDIDCFVCVILSHGVPLDTNCKSEDVVKLDELLTYLRPDRCPSLTGIPKLIFVEASLGSKIDLGVKDGVAKKVGVVKMLPNITLVPDMLVFYSSFVGYHSFKHENAGSWFIQSLSKILMRRGTEYDIMRLLTAVSNCVSLSEFSNKDNPDFNGCKQMPCIISTLIKQLKFVPRN